MWKIETIGYNIKKYKQTDLIPVDAIFLESQHIKNKLIYVFLLPKYKKFYEPDKCFQCQGKGYEEWSGGISGLIKLNCEVCNGSGEIDLRKKEKKIKTKITINSKLNNKQTKKNG